MKTFKEIVRRVLSFHLYFGALLAVVIHALWGRKSWWVDGVFVTELHPDSWPMRTWYKPWGGTCFGYGIMLAPEMPTYTLMHELVHTKQLESASAGGFLLGLICSVVTLNVLPLVVCWLMTGVLVYAGGSLISFFRGESNAYRYNHLEEAARAVGEQMDAAAIANSK